MSKKILIADDDKTLTKILASFLVENGYKVIVANDGEEALKKLQGSGGPAEVLEMAAFIAKSKRGVMRPASGGQAAEEEVG